MMTEDEYRAAMDMIAAAKAHRDEAIETAQKSLTLHIAMAYDAGLTLYDIQHATGLSITTIRSRLKEHGVEMRRSGTP